MRRALVVKVLLKFHNIGLLLLSILLFQMVGECLRLGLEVVIVARVGRSRGVLVVPVIVFWSLIIEHHLIVGSGEHKVLRRVNEDLL